MMWKICLKDVPFNLILGQGIEAGFCIISGFDFTDSADFEKAYHAGGSTLPRSRKMYRKDASFINSACVGKFKNMLNFNPQLSNVQYNL